MFLARRRLLYSEPFFEKHRRHLVRVVQKALLYFGVSATITFLFLMAYRAGKASVWEVSICLAIFVWLTAGICFGLPQSLRARIVPYFDQSLRGVDTFMSGRSLLEHSRELDTLATRLNVAPLSTFSSGDDLIPGETLTWFEPGKARVTTEALLRSELAHSFSPELRSDLEKLHEALELAEARNVRFCLLLREGGSVSGAELEKRRGVFY